MFVYAEHCTELLEMLKRFLRRELEVIGSAGSPFAVDDVLVNEAQALIAQATASAHPSMKTNQPTAAAMRASSRIDCDFRHSETEVAEIIDREFAAALKSLAFICEHFADLSKSEILNLCNEALASIEGNK